MYNVSIPKIGNNSSSFSLSLKESYETSFALILEHEWTLNLVNSQLTNLQFGSLIEQQALLYNDLARRAILLALKEPHYKELKKPANFLMNEAFKDLKLLSTSLKSIKPFDVTEYYLEIISQAWQKKLLIHKLITLIVPLWLRQDLRQQLLREPSYKKPHQEWVDQAINHNPNEVIQILSSLIDIEAKEVSEDEEFTLHPFLLKLLRSELLMRNEAYQSSTHDINPLKGD
ncbi:hypothetical protein IM40_11250 (plasmid) [Candidatus Paracaedimonas acanthamoebae]|nr:hypothetical protein IM40_11250 [Candidatus Paracaedimonas acanthamoebae]